MTKCVIFGNGQMASIAHFYLKNDSDYEVTGFTVDADHVKEGTFEGLPVVAFEQVEQHFPTSEYKIFIPISYAKMNKLRADKYLAAKAKGYQFVSYISSKAVIWPGAEIGENSFILENNVIQPFARIGNNVILWSGNHIGHHSYIMDHCYLASHVVVSGRVTVKPYCFLGVNATIRDNITLESECLIGAGALITRDTKAKEVYAGEATRAASFASDKIKNI